MATKFVYAQGTKVDKDSSMGPAHALKPIEVVLRLTKEERDELIKKLQQPQAQTLGGSTDTDIELSLIGWIE
jgi:hypothetical protein